MESLAESPLNTNTIGKNLNYAISKLSIKLFYTHSPDSVKRTGDLIDSPKQHDLAATWRAVATVGCFEDFGRLEGFPAFARDCLAVR